MGGTERSDTVLACPECDRASVQHAGPDRYQCQVCKEAFPKEEAVERERRGSNGLRGLAGRLEEIDADLVTDGGAKRSSYRWNVEVDLGGVHFIGPGMETEGEARTIKEIVEGSTHVDGVEVFRQ